MVGRWVGVEVGGFLEGWQADRLGRCSVADPFHFDTDPDPRIRFR